MMAKKGCDASNVYDEEIGEDPEYFSDDEAERAHKLKKKNRNKKKRAAEDMEEGEIIISDEEP
jgi:H/ACA ribonucleoprotein complex non-core subunit NAF1